MPNLQDIQNKLKVLSDNYATELPDKLANVGLIWQRILVEQNEIDLRELLFVCHKLAGSGTSFGFDNVSKNARAIENELHLLLASDNISSSWDEEYHSKIAILINKLLNESSLQINSTKTQDEFPDLNDANRSERKTLIYSHIKNSLLAEELISKLENYSYSIRNFSSLDELHNNFIKNIPDVVIIGSTLFNASTKKLLTELKSIHQFSLVHLADTSDFKERLEAVRIGVDYYLSKPVDFSVLIDTLEDLSSKDTIISSKVLIVDDSLSTSQFYSLSLQAVGIETKIITDPFKVMDEVINFKPELILLDLNMPKCSGLELAAVIRQQQNYISTPIVFLSGEIDTAKQLESLNSGADEFLSKPIDIQYLIAIVKNKIIRYRQIRAFINNDSLTGLLNHTHILSSLETEIERAKREQSNLSYAMLDIDYFKNINDTYGHQMGDIILKTISRFLKQNLRTTDLVGRYGGEEFVVILPGIDAVMAKTVMQKILDNFSQVEFVHLNHKFKVTFSCGITDYKSFPILDEIIEAADKALYVAKDSGRHCIKLANTL